MAEIKTIHRKGEAPIVLDLENFAHLEYGMIEIEKADLPSGAPTVVATSIPSLIQYPRLPATDRAPRKRYRVMSQP